MPPAGLSLNNYDVNEAADSVQQTLQRSSSSGDYISE